LKKESNATHTMGETSTPPTGSISFLVGMRMGSVGMYAMLQGSWVSLMSGDQVITMRTIISTEPSASTGRSTRAKVPAVSASNSAKTSILESEGDRGSAACDVKASALSHCAAANKAEDARSPPKLAPDFGRFSLTTVSTTEILWQLADRKMHGFDRDETICLGTEPDLKLERSLDAHVKFIKGLKPSKHLFVGCISLQLK